MATPDTLRYTDTYLPMDLAPSPPSGLGARLTAGNRKPSTWPCSDRQTCSEGCRIRVIL